jgi:hypothetical protein
VGLSGVTVSPNSQSEFDRLVVVYDGTTSDTNSTGLLLSTGSGVHALIMLQMPSVTGQWCQPIKTLSTQITHRLV